MRLVFSIFFCVALIGCTSETKNERVQGWDDVSGLPDGGGEDGCAVEFELSATRWVYEDGTMCIEHFERDVRQLLGDYERCMLRKAS